MDIGKIAYHMLICNVNKIIAEIRYNQSLIRFGMQGSRWYYVKFTAVFILDMVLLKW